MEEVWHAPFNYVRRSDGYAERIPPSALCILNTKHGPLVLLVDLKRHRRLADAALHFGRAFWRGSRADRYLELYKAYETIVPDRRVFIVAIRHAIAHSESALTRPKIRAALGKMFGGPTVIFGHEFYRQFVRMLIEVDQALSRELLANRLRFRQLSRERDAVFDWAIKGVPGIYEPVPLAPGSASAPSKRRNTRPL